MHLWLQSNSFEVSSKSLEKNCFNLIYQINREKFHIHPKHNLRKNLPIDFYAYSRFPNTRGVPNKSISGIFF